MPSCLYFCVFLPLSQKNMESNPLYPLNYCGLQGASSQCFYSSFKFSFFLPSLQGKNQKCPSMDASSRLGCYHDALWCTHQACVWFSFVAAGDTFRDRCPATFRRDKRSFYYFPRWCDSGYPADKSLLSGICSKFPINTCFHFTLLNDNKSQMGYKWEETWFANWVFCISLCRFSFGNE